MNFDLTSLSISLPALPLRHAGGTERVKGGLFSLTHLFVVISLIWIGMIFFLTIPTFAQGENELVLTLSRDFGYSSGTGRIQGTFTIKASGPEDLQRVVFLIDGQTMGEDDQAPFSIQFHTGSYALGVHTLSAVGYTADGRELNSNESRREFVAADEGGRAALRIALPILGVTFGIILLSTLLPILLGRGKSASIPLGAPRSYGLLGGTICPKCGRPFGMHIWGLNLLVGKMDRCPHCGKWSLVQRFPPEALKAAEVRELEMAKGGKGAPGASPEEVFNKELDDSRYQDL